MPSRFLAQQESLAGSPGIGPEHHRARARIAAYRARRGEADLARIIIDSIRTQPREILDAPLLSLINVAEGLIQLKAGNVAGGVDKWLRARAIALSADFFEGVSVSSAWLAFASYQSEDIEAIAEHARMAVAHRLSDYPQANSRLCLTIGLCFHYCGDYPRARENYLRCHSAATLCGDEIELSALIHDTAAMTIYARRCAEFFDKEPSGRLSQISTKLESVLSFEDLVGITSLPSLSPILLIHEKVTQKRWADAIDLIDNNIGKTESDGYVRLVPGLLADRALCRAMLGQPDAAQGDIELSIQALNPAIMHRDDLAIVYSRLSQVYGLCGRYSEAAAFSERAAAQWREVSAFKERLMAVAMQLDREIALLPGGASEGTAVFRSSRGLG